MTEQTQPKPLHVALLSPAWPPGVVANGVISYTATIRRALQAEGVTCHLMAQRRGWQTGPIDGAHEIVVDSNTLTWRVMRRLSPEAWPQYSFAKALLNTIRQLHATDGIQLIEIEDAYGWARLLAGKCPIPIVVRLHGPWFLNGAADGAKPGFWFRQRTIKEIQGMAAADALTAPSRDVLDQCLNRATEYRFKFPELSEVIPNPVEEVPPADRWTLAGCDKNRVAFVGRFDRHKGGDLIVDAFRTILQHRPEAMLDFIGPDRGFLDDAGRRWGFGEYIAARFSDPALRQRVTYHGFQPPAQAAEWRKRALVTVAPSRYETFGIATAEAMMAGCPLVAADAGALPELVQHGRNGLLARASDAGDLAQKVLMLLGDPELAERLGRQAAIDAQARYAPGAVARQTIDFYRRVLARRTGAAPAVTAPAESITA